MLAPALLLWRHEDEFHRLGRPLIVAGVELGVGHHQEHDAFDKADDATEANTCQKKAYHAGHRGTQVKMMNAETAEKNSQQACYRFVFASTTIHVVSPQAEKNREADLWENRRDSSSRGDKLAIEFREFRIGV